MADISIMNGELVETEKAVVKITSPGVTRGAGLFETFRTFKGHGLFVDEHMARMESSAKKLGLPEPPVSKVVSLCAWRLGEECGLADARMRLTLLDAGEGKADWFITAEILPRVRPEFRCITVKVVPSNLRRHKTTNYLENSMAYQSAVDKKRDEAILLDSVGSVLEGSMTSIFIVQRGVLVSPPLDLPILPGITRIKVIEVAQKAGIRLRESLFRQGDLLAADEVFLTNSVRGIIPVGEIDDKKVEGNVPGELTSTLQNLYNGLVEKSTREGC